jgi:hypothetical protein
MRWYLSPEEGLYCKQALSRRLIQLDGNEETQRFHSAMIASRPRAVEVDS